ncbi:MAG: hypothetical protein O7G85_08340, partial [Planctomycetota bacterium]|nr:hypothetical protein [Planctomycetota bacterium]
MNQSPDNLQLAPTIASFDLEPRLAFDRLREARFRAVQLSATQPGLKPRELDGSARRDLLGTLRRHELIVAGIDFWIPVDHFHDPIHVDRAIGATHGALELAADLGRIPLSMNLPSLNHDDSGDTARLVGSALDSISNHAERFGVMIADHSHPFVERPWIGVGFDPSAVLGRGDSPARGVATLGSQLV